jgi:hypothetical protein
MSNQNVPTPQPDNAFTDSGTSPTSPAESVLSDNWIERQAAMEACIAHSQTFDAQVDAKMERAGTFLVSFYHVEDPAGKHGLVTISDFAIEQCGLLENFHADLARQYRFFELVGTVAVIAISRSQFNVHVDDPVRAKLHKIRAEHPQVFVRPWVPHGIESSTAIPNPETPTVEGPAAEAGSTEWGTLRQRAYELLEEARSRLQVSLSTTRLFESRIVLLTPNGEIAVPFVFHNQSEKEALWAGVFSVAHAEQATAIFLVVDGCSPRGMSFDAAIHRYRAIQNMPPELRDDALVVAVSTPSHRLSLTQKYQQLLNGVQFDSLVEGSDGSKADGCWAQKLGPSHDTAITIGDGDIGLLIYLEALFPKPWIERIPTGQETLTGRA